MELNINMEDLKTMKYGELQRLAKRLGIKANMKAEKLVKTLTSYIQSEHTDTGVMLTSAVTASSGDDSHATASEDSDNEGKLNVEKKARGRKGKRKVQTKKAQKPNLSDSSDLLTPHKPRRTSSVVKDSKMRLSTHTPRTPVPVARNRTPLTPKPLSNKVTKPVTARRSYTPSPAFNKRTVPATRKVTKTPEVTVVAKGSVKRKRSSTRTPETQKEKEPSAKKQKQENGSGDGIKRTRRSTFDKPSPGVKDMLKSMKDSMTDDEQKQSLSDTLDRKAKAKANTSGYKSDSSTNSDSGTHIPRFTGLTNKKKKPVTPGKKDWEKVHQKQFDKMDSLDVYLSNKQKRAGELMSSTHKVQQLKKNMQAALESLKKHKTPPSLKKSATLAKIDKAKARAALFQSPHAGVPFIPKVTSTTKMNTTFGNTVKTPSFTGRRRLSVSAKTPANHTLPAKTPTRGIQKIVPSSSTKENTRKSLSRKSTATNPFVFSAGMNTTLNQSAKKPSSFDLKASLAKPVSWKMHSGPLKPVVAQKPTGSVESVRKNVKDVKVKTKDERRIAAKTYRAGKRFDDKMSRRNIMT